MAYQALQWSDLRKLDLAKVTRLPLGRNNYYRLRMLECRRAAVERYDHREHCWLLVHIDDSPRLAFGELIRLVRASYGAVVCAHCEVILQNPNLRNNRVVCSECILHPQRSSSSLVKAFMYGVVAAAVICAVMTAWAISHAGVLR